MRSKTIRERRVTTRLSGVLLRLLEFEAQRKCVPLAGLIRDQLVEYAAGLKWPAEEPRKEQS